MQEISRINVFHITKLQRIEKYKHWVYLITDDHAVLQSIGPAWYSLAFWDKKGYKGKSLT